MSRRWTRWAVACALLALVVSLAGCPPANYKEPVPDQAHMPLTAPMPGGDQPRNPGQTPGQPPGLAPGQLPPGTLGHVPG